MVREFIEGYLFSNVRVDYIEEQAFNRMEYCLPCVENKKCVTCGCKTPEMFFSPSKVCPQDKWGPMMDKKEWNKFKNNLLLLIIAPKLEYDPYINGTLVTKLMRFQTPVKYTIKNNKLYVYANDAIGRQDDSNNQTESPSA